MAKKEEEPKAEVKEEIKDIIDGKKKPVVDVEKGKLSDEQMAECEGGEYLTVGEVADKLRYSYAWVLWMLQEGRIKGVKPLGSRWRIPRSEFERVMKEGTPPMPRKKVPVPLNEIEVDDKTKKMVMDKPRVTEAEKKPADKLFPWNLFG